MPQHTHTQDRQREQSRPYQMQPPPDDPQWQREHTRWLQQRAYWLRHRAQRVPIHPRSRGNDRSQ